MVKFLIALFLILNPVLIHQDAWYSEWKIKGGRIIWFEQTDFVRYDRTGKPIEVITLSEKEKYLSTCKTLGVTP